MKVLTDALQCHTDNGIIPFLWIHGEEENQVRDMVARINDSGIEALCVEARPHPDFVGAKWWRDLDVVMDEAKKRNMRVWVLDDARFPTGFLNGRLAEFPQARKLLVDHYGVEVVGPAPGSSFMVHLEKEERVLGVVACLRDRSNPDRMLKIINISDRLQGDTAHWDVPEGLWCVMVLKTTYNCLDRPTHINILDRDTVRLLLDICYEPHYAHYQEEFGKTFAGFFSDEPQVGNGSGRVIGPAHMGNKMMMLSWTQEMQERLSDIWQESLPVMLTACWYDIDGISPQARLTYMTEVSRSFQVNFSEQVGNWCRERGVEYIGHVIEDNGSHMRLGHGPAHYFRALWGQDMAGIDVVLQQIRPGLEDLQFLKITGKEYYDGRFFHNLLAKLGTSLGHIDPKKKGRTICEIFGGYGWLEGLKLMKWLTDHMLVRGVNYFVPHAFNLGDFPDPDSPPHFYAQGNNPQFPYFPYLMGYMNRVSHLIRGGRHIPCVALLYSAEGEWMDAADSQPLEEVCLTLNRAQIDYEIVPSDVLTASTIANGRFKVGEEDVGALIVSSRHYMSSDLCAWCEKATEAGVPVLYINRLPKSVEASQGVSEHGTLHGEIVAFDSLTDKLRALGLVEITCDSPQPYLRYYHYAQSDGEMILFFNEDPIKAIDCWVEIPFHQNICWYDAYANVLLAAETNGNKVHLQLSPYQGLILVTPVHEKTLMPISPHAQKLDISGQWKLTMIAAGKTKAMVTEQTDLVNLCTSEKYPHFSGTMIYENSFQLDQLPEQVEIDLGAVFETAHVLLNGQDAGVCIAPPYRLRLDPKLIKTGNNTLVVTVTNTLGNLVRDESSISMPMEPVGLLGPVHLRLENKENANI